MNIDPRNDEKVRSNFLKKMAKAPKDHRDEMRYIYDMKYDGKFINKNRKFFYIIFLEIIIDNTFKKYFIIRDELDEDKKE